MTTENKFVESTLWEEAVKDIEGEDGITEKSSTWDSLQKENGSDLGFVLENIEDMAHINDSCIDMDIFHYYNSISLTSQLTPRLETSDCWKVFRTSVLLDRTIKDLYHIYGNRLVGSFGHEHLIKDINTNSKYVSVAHRPTSTLGDEHLQWSRYFLGDQKSVTLKCYDHPFVLRLLDFFLHRDLQTVWFVYEHCMCYLDAFISVLKEAVDHEELMEKYFDGESWYGDLSNELSMSLDFNLEQILQIYSYELLSAVSFLSKQNIILGNISGRTILLSVHGHIRVSGISTQRRFKLLHKKSNNFQEKLVYSDQIFNEPEKLIATLTTNEKITLQNLLKENSEDSFDLSILDVSSFDLLTDFFAVGLLLLEMYLFGLNLNDFHNLPPKIINGSSISVYAPEISRNRSFWPIIFVYDSKVNNRLIKGPLSKVMPDSEELVSLFDFVSSCLQPRPHRCKDYTSSTFLETVLESGIRRRYASKTIVEISTINNLAMYDHSPVTLPIINLFPISDSLLKILVKDPSAHDSGDDSFFEKNFTFSKMSFFSNVVEYRSQFKWT